MNFEEALADLIAKHLEREGYDGIISGLELQMMAMKEQEAEALSESDQCAAEGVEGWRSAGGRSRTFKAQAFLSREF